MLFNIRYWHSRFLGGVAVVRNIGLNTKKSDLYGNQGLSPSGLQQAVLYSFK